MAVHVLAPGAKPWRPLQVIETDIAAASTWTEPMTVLASERVSVSVSDIYEGTVILQRMLNTQDWYSVPSADGSIGFTAPTEQTYDADEACFLRLGFADDFVSGSAHCRLGKG